MGFLLDHLIIMPILLPMATGAFLLLFDERRRPFKAAISIGSALLLLVISVSLMVSVNAADGVATTQTYRLGDWPAPFGIVLVADRLSALMLVLAAILGVCSLIFSIARWHSAGPSFHSLVQFLLMGLSGAFLTGDLFNLFVFFEVLLAASYGLTLHGSGSQRVRAGLHYIAINLAGSMLFLIGVSLIYGVTGTLNMADLATRIPNIALADRSLLETGMALLGTAFLIKAGMWPLSFWLPTTYAAASAPAAALFAIMSKVGIYVILRLSLLLAGEGAGISAGLGGGLLLYGGMATIVFGTVGMLASQGVARLAGFSVLVSSGTLLASIGMGEAAVTGGALFYLVSSTLTASALFLLIELVERARIAGADILAVTMEAFGEDDEELAHEEEVGIAIPATLAVLGICFAACAMLLSGLPPFSGFIAKFAILHGLLATGTNIAASTWVVVALLIVSGFAALIGMTRIGISTFWASLESSIPHVRVIEILPIAVLISLCLVLTVQGGAVMAYMEATAASLHLPESYVQTVMGVPSIAGKTP